MPAHIYPNKIYTPYSLELKELVAELSKKGYKLELEEDEEEEVKYVRLVKDDNHRITLVFMRIGNKDVLHYIEISAMFENEYNRIIEKIREKIKVYSVGWI